jgi:hypothetical protein
LYDRPIFQLYFDLFAIQLLQEFDQLHCC